MQAQPLQSDATQDEDPQLTAATENSVRVLEGAGITVQDLLDELPAARTEVVSKAYGPAFLKKLERELDWARRPSSKQ